MMEFPCPVAPRSLGFTLVELLVALAVLAVVLTIGIPSFTNLISNNRATTATNDFIAALQFTRSEAVRQNASIDLCSSTDQTTCSNSDAWQTGWVVLWNNQPIQVRPALNPAIQLVGAPVVRFGSAGEVTLGAGQFDVSATGGAVSNRVICLEVSGRAFAGACE